MLFWRRLSKGFKQQAERLAGTLGCKIMQSSAHITKKANTHAILMGQSAPAQKGGTARSLDRFKSVPCAKAHGRVHIHTDEGMPFFFFFKKLYMWRSCAGSYPPIY